MKRPFLSLVVLVALSLAVPASAEICSAANPTSCPPDSPDPQSVAAAPSDNGEEICDVSKPVTCPPGSLGFDVTIQEICDVANPVSCPPGSLGFNLSVGLEEICDVANPVGCPPDILFMWDFLVMTQDDNEDICSVVNPAGCT